MKVYEVTANITLLDNGRTKTNRIYIFSENASAAHISVKKAINASKDMRGTVIRVKEITPRKNIIFAMS